jgi:hypothetical protein
MRQFDTQLSEIAVRVFEIVAKLTTAVLAFLLQTGGRNGRILCLSSIFSI